MALASDLMNLGLPGPIANLIGDTPSTLVTTGTTAATAAAIRSNFVVLTTAGSQTGALLPAASASGGMPGGSPSDIITVTNPTATTGIVYPEVGGTLNGGTVTTGGQNLAQNKTAVFIRVAALTWVSILTA